MKKGMSLVEVVMAIGMFMALVIPFTAIFLTSARDIKRIGNYNVAILFAQDAIEACKGYPVNRLDSDEETDPDKKKYYLEEAFKTGELTRVILRDEEEPIEEDTYWHKAIVNGVEYTRDVDIQSLDSDPGIDVNVKLKLVKVTVTWQKPGSDDKLSYTASCVVGN